MSTVPADTPQKSPVVLPIVAMVTSELLHVPPGVGLVSVLQKPIHVAAKPPIGPGNGFTVTTTVVKHPVGNVNVIVATPALLPVTTPVTELIPAIVALLVLHVPGPPGEALLSVMVEPTHTTGVPSIGSGSGFTVTLFALVQPVASV